MDSPIANPDNENALAPKAIARCKNERLLSIFQLA
jgi:hypothetical protein